MPSAAVSSRRAHLSGLLAAAAGTMLLSGCTWVSYLGCDPRGGESGKVYYVGGAGPFGHVGTIDVPKGLRQAGYHGAIEVFGWQSIVGGTLRDQMDRARNQGQARRLAERIEAYRRRHPAGRIDLIALSAGTGIVTWALESLPESVRIGTVVFLSSSLSRSYDLGPALRHLDGKLYNFYSPDDPVLRYTVPLAGSVDRDVRGPSLAGLLGFEPPPDADEATVGLYAQHLRLMPYRQRYRQYGYRGMHTDATTVKFVEQVIAPLLTAPATDGEQPSQVNPQLEAQGPS